VFTASSKSEAKERVHDKWYSILAVEELDETKLNWEKIIFKAIKDWEIKNWKVIWTDLFKIYLKLTDWLWYDVNEIFYEKDKDISTEEKEKLLIKIKKQYNLYHELNSKNKKEKSKSEKFKEKEWKYDLHTEWFYLRKKLEENYKLLNFVLEKLQNLFTDEKFSDLEQEKIKKLKEIYNKLIILKQSTNIWKIKQVSELALIKIWEIELSLIENKKDKNASKLLDNTNKLLKQIWSKTQFRPKNKDINYQLKVKYEHIKKIIQDYIKWNLTKNKKVIDEQSTFYLSTVLWIKKYKNRLQNNTRNILKNIYVFLFPFWESKEKRDRLLIERRLINSNLILLKSKINQNNFSYTKVKKWYNWFIEIILLFFEKIRQYLFVVIFFYSLLFLTVLIISYYNIWGLSYISETINYRWIFYFLVFMFIYLAMYLSRWIWTLIINFSLVFMIIIFWLINF
jgi:hypothetical protein